MGRGRQKAKHTKVARELKYYVPDTDYNRLERELSSQSHGGPSEDELSKWAEYADQYEEDDVDEGEDSAQQKRA